MFGWFRRKKSSPPVPVAPKGPLQDVQGRSYLVDDPYMLPKDMSEINRLDFQHYLLRSALRSNYLAPLNPAAIHDILDVGTGTGRWAFEMAQQFPQANVFGVDRVIQTSVSQPPPNYVFMEGNLFTGLPFADASFDFVHQRLLYSAIPLQLWPQVIRELIRVTRPGGWIELVEAATLENRSPAADQLNTWVFDACSRRGLDMVVAPRLASMLGEAGVQGATTRQIAIPIGAHGGRLGAMMETDITEIYRSVGPLVTSAGITTQAEYDQTVARWRSEIPSYQMTFPFLYH